MENIITYSTEDSDMNINNQQLEMHEFSRDGSEFQRETMQHHLDSIKFYERAKYKKAFFNIDPKPKRFLPKLSINMMLGIGLLLFIFYVLISKYILIS